MLNTENERIDTKASHLFLMINQRGWS